MIHLDSDLGRDFLTCISDEDDLRSSLCVTNFLVILYGVRNWEKNTYFWIFSRTRRPTEKLQYHTFFPGDGL